MAKLIPLHALIAVLGISILGNILLTGYIAFAPKKIPRDTSRESVSALPFLAPRIFAEKQNDVIINFIDLRTKLREYTQKTSERLGIYFEYLPSGTSIGISEKEEFELASLLKVPIAMAALDQIHAGTMAPTTMLTLEKSHLDPYYGELWQEGPGYQVPLEKAIEIMIVKSDNTAARVISENMPDGATEKIFDLLDIPKVQKGMALVVTPKNYSSILRSLYLASILPKEESNQLLSLLTRTDFRDRIQAGVPDTVPVAHKVGIHTSPDESKSIFTDCGIVYVPKRPYVLCVMIEGQEARTLSYMTEISRIIYTYVSSVNTEN